MLSLGEANVGSDTVLLAGGQGGVHLTERQLTPNDGTDTTTGQIDGHDSVDRGHVLAFVKIQNRGGALLETVL